MNEAHISQEVREALVDLKSESGYERRIAIETLGNLKDENSIEPLIHAFKKETISERKREIATVLTSLKDLYSITQEVLPNFLEIESEVKIHEFIGRYDCDYFPSPSEITYEIEMLDKELLVELLLEYLESRYYDWRTSENIGEYFDLFEILRHPKTIPILIEIVGNESFGDAAVEILKEFEYDLLQDILGGWYQNRYWKYNVAEIRIWESINERKAIIRKLYTLFSCLSDEDSRVCSESRRVLKNFVNYFQYKPAIESILINDADDIQYHHIAYVKSFQNDARAFFFLEYFIHKGNYLTIELMGEIAEQRAIQPLLEILNEENTNLKEYAAKALIDIQEINGQNELLQINQEKIEKWAKEREISIMQKKARETTLEAIHHLIIAFDVEDPATYQLEKAIVKYQEYAIDEIVQVLCSYGENKLEKYNFHKEITPYMKDDLVNCLESVTIDFPINAVLTAVEDKNIQHLLPFLDTKNQKLKLSIINVLGYVGDQRALEPLLNLYEKTDYYRYQNAVLDALEKLGHYRTNLKEKSSKQVAETATDIYKKYYFRNIVEENNEIHLRNVLDRSLVSLNKEERIHAAIVLGKLKDSRAIDELINILSSENSFLKVEACFLLGDFKDIKAVEPLIKRLTDEELFVKIAAIKALANLDDKRAVNPLINVLKNDQNINVKANTVKTLVQLKDEKTVEILIETLAEIPTSGDFIWDHKLENWGTLKDIVAYALGELGDERAIEILKEKSEEENLGWGVPFALSELSNEINIEDLKIMLEDENRSVKERAFALASDLGTEEVVDALIERLEEEAGYEFLFYVAKTLGQIGNSKAVEPLLQMLERLKVGINYPNNGNSDDGRSDFIEALGRIGDKEAVEPLITCLLEDGYKFHRAEAAQALGRIGDKRAVDPLIKVLRKDNEIVKSGCIDALRRIKDKRAVKPMIDVLSHRLTGGATYADGGGNIGNQLGTVLGDFGDVQTIQPLISALKDEYGQLGVPYALAKLGGEKVADIMIDAVKNCSSDYKTGIILALGEIKEDRVIDAILETLKDKEFSVKEQSIIALGKLKSKKGFSPLIDLLNHKESLKKNYDEWTACSLLQSTIVALGEIGNREAIKSLRNMLNDKDIFVRMNVAEALVKLGEASSIEILLNIMEKPDEYVKYAAISSDFAEENIKHNAALILANFGDKRAVKPLIEIIEEATDENSWEGSFASIRFSAIQALGEIGDPRAIKPLENALRDCHFYIHEAAEEALKKIREK
jgi:HEAT repeat protein